MPDSQTLGPYRLERVLGTGSFATVWLARDEVLDRHVAVKILADNWSRDHDVRRRFLSEAKVLLTVESPRIVRGFHLGETPTGQPYLVMAWADRGTLGDRIEQRRREGRCFDVAEVIGIGAEIAQALADVHHSGHLHRDIKPTNVLIRSSSTQRRIPGLAIDETIVLADFGLARGLDMSALTLVAGSPGYVAPEQAGGLTQLDRRADLYSLGRMMLELLTGDPGGRATTMAGAANERIDVEAEVAELAERGEEAPPPALVGLISRLVAEQPDDRPSTADQVAAELASLRIASSGSTPGPPIRPLAGDLGAGDGTKPTGTQLGAPVAADRRTWGRRQLAAAGAVAAAAIAVLVLLLARGDGGGRANSTTTLGGIPPGPSTVAVVAGDSTAPASSAGPDSTIPASSAPSEDPTPASTGDVPGAPTVPTGVTRAEPLTVPSQYVLDSVPDSMLSGVRAITPAAFFDELLADNPGWSVDGATPDLGSLGYREPVSFTVTDGVQTATVTLALRGEDTDVDLTTFEIVYS